MGTPCSELTLCRACAREGGAPGASGDTSSGWRELPAASLEGTVPELPCLGQTNGSGSSPHILSHRTGF